MYTEYLDKITELIRSSRIYYENEWISDWEKGFQGIVSCFIQAKQEDKKVIFIGNGGSAAIAGHMSADFMKNGGMRTINLYDNALTTCIGNDYGYEYVFSKPLEFLAREGDLLVAVSSSGNSQNIVNAVNVAKGKGLVVITFSGFREDNKVRQMGDYNLYVPIEHYGIVESIHNLFLQQIVDAILEKEGKM